MSNRKEKETSANVHAIILPVVSAADFTLLVPALLDLKKPIKLGSAN